MNKDIAKKIQNLFSDYKVDALFITSYANISYLTSFSGFSKEEQEAYLLLTKNNNYIFTDSRYLELINNKVKGFVSIKISSNTSFIESFKKIIFKEKIKKISFEEDDLTFLEFKKLKKDIKAKFIPHQNILKDERMIKTEKEIEIIKKACDLTDQTCGHLLKIIKINSTERQLAAEIEYFIKKNNAQTAFDPIVAFGKNSSIPHHQPTDKKLNEKDIILLDFGAKVDNYCSDITRTVFLGKPTTEQKNVYQTVLEAQQKAIDFLNNLTIKQFNNEIKAYKVDKAARNYIISKGFPSIPHSLGHGIGIEIHEFPKLSPSSKDVLKPGMVFSIEPGIYFEGKFGVRIEDTVLTEKNGIQILTKSPKNLTQL